jgi:hypothetical protein
MGQQASKKKEGNEQSSRKDPTSAGLTSVLLMMDQYPIKLTAQQCVLLYGFMSSKPRILRWADVIEHGSEITFRKCVEAKVDIQKLYNMQRDLQQWIQHGKVCVEDCADLAPWKPNPFLDFNCHIGDLVVRRHVLTHGVLVRGGVTFESLWERFGLTPAVMAMIRFTTEEWIELGIQEQHLEPLSSSVDQWETIFKRLSRQEVVEAIRRRNARLQAEEEKGARHGGTSLGAAGTKACYY